MKAQREAAEKAMSAKLKRLGAQGDKKFAMHDRKGYATGGGVTNAATNDMDVGGSIGGDAPKPNLSKPSRAGVKGKKPGGGKAGGKGKTNVNVIIMSGAPGGPEGPKPPMPPMPPGGPMGPGAPMMPPKPPMPPMGGPGGGPGGPPMPMRKYGGRVKMAGASKPVGKGKKSC